MDNYKLVVWGGNEELYKNNDREHSIRSAIVFYNSGASEIVKFNDFEDFKKFRLKLADVSLDDMLTLFDSSVLYNDLLLMSEAKYTFSDEAKADFLAGKELSDEVRAKVLDKIEKNKQKEAGTFIPEPIFADPEVEAMKTEVVEKPEDKFAKIAARGLATAGAAAILAGTISACGPKLKDSSPEIVPIESEQTSQNASEDKEVAEVPSMVGKEYPFYEKNAIDTLQKDLFVNNVSAWVKSANNNEGWEQVTLTEEKAKELGYANPECLYGFTAEEAYSLALRFGKYTNDEYVTITGGSNLNVVDIMDDAHSMSNGALSKITAYYINSDECNLHIDGIINFNEKEKALNNKLEETFREYKQLEAQEGKEKEALAKMKELKQEMQELAYNTDFEISNFKSYALRTFLPAASVISQVHQYKDTISIDLYDVNKNTQVSKNIKVELFDEITMRSLVLGYEETKDTKAFDPEAFLEEHGISKTRYNLLYTDVFKSIADQSCGAQSERLQQANEYISMLKKENLDAETIVAEQRGITGTLIDDLNNVKTRYDELTYGTYHTDAIIKMINDQLVKDNTYPKNVQYFTTAYITEKSIEYKNTHGVTKGKKGDKIVVNEKIQAPATEQQMSAPGNVVLNHENEKVTASEAMAEARQEEVERTGIADASTEEAAKAAEEAAYNSEEYKQVQTELQNTYEEVKENIVHGDGSKADSNSNNLAVQKATEDGLKEKQIDEEIKKNPTIGGETTILPGFEDVEIYDAPQAPVASVDKTTNNEPKYAVVVEDTKSDVKEVINNTNVTTTNTTTVTNENINNKVEDTNNTSKEEGILDYDPTLNNPTFAPVVYSEAEISAILDDFSAVELAELLGESEVVENNDGYTK